MNLNSTYLESVKKSLGIAFGISGVQLGMYFNQLFPFVNWSPIFMALSVFCIFSFKNLLFGHLPTYNQTFTWILLFQFLMLIYGIFSSNLSFQFLSFHLYIICLIIALASNKHIDFSQVLKVIFLVSAVCSLLGAFYVSIGFVTGRQAWELRHSDDDFALEPFTVALGSLINFAASLLLLNRRLWFKIVVILFLLLDLYVILYSGKRTPIFIAIVIFGLFFLKKGLLSKNEIFKYLRLIGFILALVFSLYFSIEAVQVRIDNFVDNFINGLANILGYQNVSDDSGSGIIRYQARQETYEFINLRFNFFNYIFGYGYMTKWIDNPILQSYLDMGILGLFFYTYLIIIYPIRIILRKFKISDFTLLTLMLSIYGTLSAINSGHPYVYLRYLPIALLAWSLKINQAKTKSNRPSTNQV